MKIEIELTDREAELLAGWFIPTGLCGTTVQDRIGFLIQEQCDFLKGQEQKRRTSKLYTLLGLPDPNLFIDDDIPF